jgi:hypothetical protein
MYRLHTHTAQESVFKALRNSRIYIRIVFPFLRLSLLVLLILLVEDAVEGRNHAALRLPESDAI